MSALNLNIGPGDCEWFVVPQEYWGVFHEICERNKIDYLSGVYDWDNSLELYEIKRVHFFHFFLKLNFEIL